MPLPILKSTVEATPQTLLRFFHQTELQWTRHLAQETQLDAGTAMHNPELSRIYIANRVIDVALPEGTSPQQALAEVTSHFDPHGLKCWQWVMNPSAAPEQTQPMIEHLLSLGYTPDVLDIMHLQHMPNRVIEGAATGLTVIPARASFKHTRALMEESARKWNQPEIADAAMMHLDDPHYDALLALKDGSPVAHVGVLAMGEVGLIEQVFVTESMRGQGIAIAMMSRALEICARSLFKQVLLSVSPQNAPAIHIYEKFGFRKIAQYIAYQHPVSRSSVEA